MPHLHIVLGQRLRALCQHRGLSQARLAVLAGLSGKFIGEVERGKKSISVDSLYRLAVALRVPLRHVADIQKVVPANVDEIEKIYAFVAALRRASDVRKVHKVLRTILDGN